METFLIKLISYTSSNLGERIRIIRDLLNMSRKDFEVQYGIMQFTMKKWELGQASISATQFKKLLEAFRKAGIHCTEEWLMFGTGIAPLLIDKTNELLPSLSSENSIETEAILFKHYYPHAVMTKITDNVMFPFYEIDDYVVGVKIDIKDISDFYGKPCLIQLDDDSSLVRILYKGGKEDSFTIGGFNPSHYLPEFFKIDIQPKAIFKIIWHRKNANFS